ncbi:MAG: hypothetical protein PHC61_17035, partial [Chitinivibrionales bacterium]|nr:hypothetical protein [Chitinivibrionales bacterium]
PQAYSAAAAEAAPASDNNDEFYFTSANTERPRRKIKKPVNPRKQQQGFFSRLFNRSNPE